MEQREPATSSCNLFELLDHQHLPLQIIEGVFEVSLERFVLISFWITLHYFLSSDVFTGWNFAENLLLHRPNPRLGLETEKHGYVPFGGVANSVVKQTAHDNIRIQLDIGPVVERKFVDTIEQFLLLLEQDVLVERRETIAVVME